MAFRAAFLSSCLDPSQFLLCETVVDVESESLLLNAQKWMGFVVHYLHEVIVGYVDEFLNRLGLGFGKKSFWRVTTG